MMLVYRRQPSHCLPVPSQRMPGTSCSRLSTHSEEGRGEGTSEWQTNSRHRGDAVAQWKFLKVNKCAQFVRQATIVCLMEAHLPVCVCVWVCVCVCQCTWLCVSARKDKLHLRVWRQAHTKCWGLLETDVGYAAAWMGSHYIIRVSPSSFFPHFSSHTLPSNPAAGVNHYLLHRFNATFPLEKKLSLHFHWFLSIRAIGVTSTLKERKITLLLPHPSSNGMFAHKIGVFRLKLTTKPIRETANKL